MKTSLRVFPIVLFAVIGFSEHCWSQDKSSKTTKEKATHEEKSVSQWILLLADKDTVIREDAAYHLGLIGPEAKKAVPTLIRTLKDKSPRVCKRAFEALEKIGPAAIPELIEALKDKNKKVRSMAASALGKIGPKANKAIPALIKLLKGKGKIDPKADQETRSITMIARYSGDRVRLYSALALGEIGPQAIPELIKLLKEKDNRVRYFAMRALMEMGPKAEKAIPDLIAVLKEDNFRMHRIAISTLAYVGLKAIPALVKLLSDKEMHVRSNAAEALGYMGPKAKKTVPELIKLLRDKEAWVRRGAVNAIGSICAGSKDIKIVERLKSLSNEKDYFVKESVKWALKRVLQEK